MWGSIFSGSFDFIANVLKHFGHYNFSLVLLVLTDPSRVTSLPFPLLSGWVCWVSFLASPYSFFANLQHALPLSSRLRLNTGFCQSVAPARDWKEGGKAWKKVRSGYLFPWLFPMGFGGSLHLKSQLLTGDSFPSSVLPVWTSVPSLHLPSGLGW